MPEKYPYRLMFVHLKRILSTAQWKLFQDVVLFFNSGVDKIAVNQNCVILSITRAVFGNWQFQVACVRRIVSIDTYNFPLFVVVLPGVTGYTSGSYFEAIAIRGISTDRHAKVA